jgi:hypothetical protein
VSLDLGQSGADVQRAEDAQICTGNAGLPVVPVLQGPQGNAFPLNLPPGRGPTDLQRCEVSVGAAV